MMKTKLITWSFCGAFLALMASTVHAATTNSWKSAVSGKWETSGNWSVHAPGSSDGIELITNAATKTITIDATTTSSTNTLSISNLYIAGTSTSTNTLFLNNAGTNTPLQIISSAFDTFTIETNASLVVSASAIVATNSGSIMTIGNRGSHSSLVISNGGVAFCTTAEINGNNNTALVTGSGSVWNFQSGFDVGLFGTGNTFTVSNGGLVQSPGGGGVTQVSADINSRSNVVVITGPGSAWKCSGDLLFGQEGPGNLLTITNGGTVVAGIFQEGGIPAASNNLVLVTGAGSVLSNSNGPFGTPGTLIIGNESVGNTLMIANGGEVLSGTGGMGFNSPGSNNFATVTGPGSVWNLISFNIGMVAGGNKVTIANSGMVLASNLFVGSFGTSPSNNLLQVSGGSLFATNGLGTGLLVIGPGGLSNAFVLDSGSATVDNFMAPTAGGSSRLSLNGGTLTVKTATIINGLDFVIGGTNTSATYIANGGAQFFENNLVVQRGTFTMNGGTVTVNQFVLTNANTTAALNGGQFNTPGTFVTNGAQFVVGNGTAHANFHLLGGEHDFHDGLRVSNGASLTGCGTITGDVTIDAGGSIFATCDTLTFTGTVINNGALAANGATLEFYGPVINNNGLLFYNGGTTNFHGTFMNNGIITNAGPVIVTSIIRTGNDVVVTAPSALDFDYQLQIANTLNSPIWTNSGPIQPGTGTPLTFTDPGGATNKPNRYYQVDVVWPP